MVRSFLFPHSWAVRVGIIMVMLLILAIVLWRMWGAWAPSRADYPVQGVSVSAAQGDIDWRSVRAQDADFAYIRATHGAHGRDQSFARNWAGARDAGLRYGAELRFSLCHLAVDQATLFIATVPRDNAALPPVVRFTFSPDCPARPGRDTILSETNTLLNMIEAHAGKPALLHISPDFERQYSLSLGINRTLWMDGDFFPPDYGARPWVMWTASDARMIEGVDTPVEWNVVAR